MPNLHESYQGLRQRTGDILRKIWPSRQDLNAKYEKILRTRDLADSADFNLGINAKGAIAIFILAAAGNHLLNTQPELLSDLFSPQPQSTGPTSDVPGDRIVPATIVFPEGTPATTEISITKQGGVFDKNGEQIWAGPVNPMNLIGYDGQPVNVVPIIDKISLPDSQKSMLVATKFMTPDETRVWNLTVPAREAPLPEGIPEIVGLVQMPSDEMENYLRINSSPDVQPSTVTNRNKLLNIPYSYLGIKRPDGTTAVFVDDNNQAKLFSDIDLADKLCPVDFLNREYGIVTRPSWLDPEFNRFGLPVEIRVLPLEGTYEPNPFNLANMLRKDLTAAEKGISVRQTWWELAPSCGINSLIQSQP